MDKMSCDKERESLTKRKNNSYTVYHRQLDIMYIMYYCVIRLDNHTIMRYTTPCIIRTLDTVLYHGVYHRYHGVIESKTQYL